tara:strand:+ start:1448 stop:3970 length:2523 start_codon:yes stop_codon:yes gene_type:complete
MKIKYGIDLGTTNSGIASINKGESIIIKNSLQKDTTPSCVGFTKKKGIRVGDSAYNQLSKDKLTAIKTGGKYESNVFVEFKRTMGSDKKYHSTFMGKDYSSEELSAEILKNLKSSTQEDFKSVVITIPAMFNDNQKTATQRAAELAGFSQVELLQEPIAAAMAYGLDEKVGDGQILIFDFGGGTFDVCLVNVEDGIMQVKDTEGDNWLGGKNLDNAIVDEIIMPYVKENYKVDSLLNDELSGTLLREAIKVEGEKIKISLSFSDSYDVISDIGDYPEDDEGEEIELDFSVTKDDMERVLGPIFQKSIDITKDVLKRNNLDGKSIQSLILVGGPTFSPVLRNMLKEQICQADTSVDPMTVVSRGAAIYASTFDISTEIKDEIRDTSKVQLELSYESQSVETEEMLVVKVDLDKTDGDIPSKIFVQVKRADGGWDSENKELDVSGDIIDLQLVEGRPNIYNILLTDDKGSNIECEPSEITIMQGVKTGNATLPYNYGVELVGPNGRGLFYLIPGLEKGQTMPATGEKPNLKTLIDLKPGSNDEINISIYQGTVEAEGTRAINQLWVSTAVLSGNDISKLLPKGSDVNLVLEIPKDGEYNLSIDIPFLNDTIEKPLVLGEQKGEDDKWYSDQFKNLDNEIADFEKDINSQNKSKLDKIKFDLAKAKKEFDSRKTDFDTRMKVRDDIRKIFSQLDNLQDDNLLPSAVEKLKSAFDNLKKEMVGSENEFHKTAFNSLKSRVEPVLASEDIGQINDLAEEIASLWVTIVDEKHGADLYISMLMNFNDDFESQPWSDKSKARSIINNALSNVKNLNKDTAIGYLRQLYKLLPNPNQSGGGPDGILGA